MRPLLEKISPILRSRSGRIADSGERGISQSRRCEGYAKVSYKGRGRRERGGRGYCGRGAANKKGRGAFAPRPSTHPRGRVIPAKAGTYRKAPCPRKREPTGRRPVRESGNLLEGVLSRVGGNLLEGALSAKAGTYWKTSFPRKREPTGSALSAKAPPYSSLPSAPCPVAPPTPILAPMSAPQASVGQAQRPQRGRSSPAPFLPHFCPKTPHRRPISSPALGVNGAE